MYRLLFLLFIYLLLSCQNNGERIQVQRKNLTESVYASATVEADSLYYAYATIPGVIESFYVTEGDTVVKGSDLFKIKSINAELETANAKLNLEKARTDLQGSNAILRSLEDEIEAARLKYHNDSVNFNRQQRLWSQKIGSETEFETMKLAFELSKNNLQRLRLNYDRTRDELEIRYKQAGNQYRSSIITTGDFTVRSQIEGTVYSVLKNKGEVVSSLEPVASVGASHRFLITLLVDETDIVKLRPQQQILLTLDAYGDKVFEAVVDKILPDKDIRNQTFKVEAGFKELPEVLYPGLSGEANIITNVKEDILVIPRAYLQASSVVNTDKGEVEITTGLQNLEYIEVTSGLVEGQWILKPKQ